MKYYNISVILDQNACPIFEQELLTKFYGKINKVSAANGKENAKIVNTMEFVHIVAFFIYILYVHASEKEYIPPDKYWLVN